MTVIYVERIETCQQDDESINTQVIGDAWYNKKTVFLHQWLCQFCQNLFSFHTPKDSLNYCC